MSLEQVVAELQTIVDNLDSLNTKSNTVLDKANNVLDKVDPILDTSTGALVSLKRIEKLLTIGLFILLGIILIVFITYLVSKYITIRHVTSRVGQGVEMVSLHK